MTLVALDADTYLLTRAKAHAARLGISLAAHNDHCDCLRKPSFCACCDRDFENTDVLEFAASEQGFFCEDCRLESAERANERALNRYYGSDVPQTSTERKAVGQ